VLVELAVLVTRMSSLDIRWPLGSIFTLIGAILAVYGALSAWPIAASAAIDIVWGGVLMLFGASMLLLAHRAGAKPHG
jgi:steroid 5-alpha reductase family enzyme